MRVKNMEIIGNNTKIGLAVDGQYGVEFKIDSLAKDGSQSWVVSGSVNRHRTVRVWHKSFIDTVFWALSHLVSCLRKDSIARVTKSPSHSSPIAPDLPCP